MRLEKYPGHENCEGRRRYVVRLDPAGQMPVSVRDGLAEDTSLRALASMLLSLLGKISNAVDSSQNPRLYKPTYGDGGPVEPSRTSIYGAPHTLLFVRWRSTHFLEKEPAAQRQIHNHVKEPSSWNNNQAELAARGHSATTVPRAIDLVLLGDK